MLPKLRVEAILAGKMGPYTASDNLVFPKLGRMKMDSREGQSTEKGDEISTY